jgi:hypothetical protein
MSHRHDERGSEHFGGADVVSCFEVTIRPKGFLEVGKLIITATVKNPENMFFLTWAMQPD